MSLLERVIAHPDYAEARAVYADHCEEAGQRALAACIRRSGPADIPEHPLSALDLPLQRRLAKAWARKERDANTVCSGGVQFFRGLPASVGDTISKLTTKAGKARYQRFLTTYGADRLQLHKPTKKPEALADLPVRQARWVQWNESHLTDAQMGAVGGVLKDARRLYIRKSRFSDAGLTAFAAAGLQLEELVIAESVHGGAHTSAGLIALLEATPSLRALSDGGFRSAFRELAASPAVSNLERLGRRADLASLVESRHFASLREVAVHGPMDTALLEALADHAHLPALERLTLTCPHPIPDTALDRLRDRFTVQVA